MNDVSEYPASISSNRAGGRNRPEGDQGMLPVRYVDGRSAIKPATPFKPQLKSSPKHDPHNGDCSRLTMSDEFALQVRTESLARQRPSGTHATKVRRSVRPPGRAERHFKAS